MLYFPQTRIELSIERPLLPGVTVNAEGSALSGIISAGAYGVQPTTGTADIFAGVAVEIPEIVHALKAGGQDPVVLFMGVIVSFVVGLATIHFFMKLIAKINLAWFTAYRMILAIVLVFLLMQP